MQQSTVKWFDAKKGYGFIHHPDEGEDVFVHYSNIESDDDFKTLHADQHVRFELNDGPKGLNASNVQALNEPDTSSTSQEPSGNGTEESTESVPEIDPSEIDPTAEVDPTFTRE